MTLRAEAEALLDDVVNAERRLDRPELIKRLRTLTMAIPETLPAAPAYEMPFVGDDPREVSSTKVYARNSENARPQPDFNPRENTPVRKVVSNWTMSKCKRCMGPDNPGKMTIVQIKGQGWWHDACFRAVRPEFYVGLD